MKNTDPFPIRLRFFRDDIEIHRMEILDGPSGAEVVAELGGLRVHLATDDDGWLIRGPIRHVEDVRDAEPVSADET